MSEADIDGSVLLEREEERRQLSTALEASAGGAGSLIVIDGEAGIGKTSLVRDAAREAAGRGFVVCSATAGELEQDVPYGIVRQLFSAVAADADLFGGSARFAAELFDGSRGTSSPSHAESVPLGLYWLVAGLSERAPLLLSVDDLQWADLPSVRFLAYLARRFEGLRVLVVAAERTGGGAVATESLRAAAGERLVALRPRSLSLEAVVNLARTTIGRSASPEFGAACRASTGGNPFLVGELLRELAAEGWHGEPAEAAAVRDVGPRTVAHAVLVRLARLSADAVEVARCLAVLGEASELRYLALLAGLDGDAVAGVVAVLARSHVVEDVRPIRFVHPVVRQAVYDDLTLSERASLHGRAARMFAADAAPDDVVAAHFVLAEPLGDPEAAAFLRAAAQGALAHWDTERACRYLERALREPPAAAVRDDMEIELRLSEVLDQRPGAMEQLRSVLSRATDLEGRVLIARILAGRLFLGDRAAESIEVLRGTLDVVEEAIETFRPEPGDDAPGPELQALMLEADLADTAAFDPAGQAALHGAFARLGAVDAITEPGTYPERVALLSRAGARVRAGDPVGECSRLVHLAWRDAPPAFLNPASPKFVTTVGALIYCEETALASATLEEALEVSRRDGSALGYAQTMMMRVLLATRQGQLVRAEADARGVEDAGIELPVQLTRLWVGWWVQVLALRGEVDEADAVLARFDLTGDLGGDYTAAMVYEGRGWLGLVRGDLAGSAAAFLCCGERLEGLGMTNPSVSAWRSGAARALATTDPSNARDLAEQGLVAARRFGTPRSIGVALWGVAATVRDDEKLARLEEAAEVLDGSSAVLDHARVLVDTGMALRRAKRRGTARDPLRRGLDLATKCGANVLAARAEAELRAAGAKPRRRTLTGPAALTPSEDRVAGMAAEGLTNRQIAEQLFVSLRTVENHLSGVFRKLGIQSRTQLAGVLDGGQQPEGAAE